MQLELKEKESAGQPARHSVVESWLIGINVPIRHLVQLFQLIEHCVQF